MTPAQKENLRRLLAPESIAFIGGDSAVLAVEQCLRGGFKGEVWGVNPKRADMLGRPCFPSVDDLPGPPDAAFLAAPGGQAAAIVTALEKKGAGGVVGYTAGFAETGARGAAQERELVKAAGQMALVGPNCSGVLSFAHGAALWPFDHAAHPPGRGAAFISQSGMLGNTITMNQRSVPLAYVISAGNQAMLGIEDYLDFMIDDPAVSAVALYIEGLRDVRRFAAAAVRAVERGVPVIAFKAGSSDIGAQLTVTHTGSLSGDDALYDALFERTGVIRADSPVQMLESLKLAVFAGPPEGKKLAVFTCSGGDSAMAADAAAAAGVELPQPSQAASQALRRILPPIASVTNPLDYTTPLWGREAEVKQAMTAMLADGYDAALLVQDYPVHNPGPGYEPYLADARAFVSAAAEAGAPAAVCSVLPENIDQKTRAWFIENGAAPLQGVNEALTAFAAVQPLGALRQRLKNGLDPAGLGLAEAGAPPVGEARILNEWEGKQLLKKAGVAVPEGRCVSAADAPGAADEIGYPAAVKMMSSALPHKTEAGALRLDVRDRAGIEQACTDIRRSVSAYDKAAVTDLFLIERMVKNTAAEFIAGVRRDAQFGFVLVIGSGGVLVELAADSEALLLPADKTMIAQAVNRLAAARLLDGFRGRPAASREALYDAIAAIASFALNNRSWLLEIDVNPLTASPGGVTAADVLIRGCGPGAPA